jgi:hypothetical protein
VILVKLENYKKSNINDADIKSNILNYSVMRIDYKGLLSFDDFIGDFQNFLNSIDFLAEKEQLSLEDLKIIDAVETFENYIDKEPVVRFIKNDNMTRIIVTRFFTYIHLDYKAKHKLETTIGIFNKLVNIIKEKNKEFVIFKRITLKKNNNVIASTMNNILACFETRLFNVSPFEINRISKQDKTDLLASEFRNEFIWTNITYAVGGNISKGYTKIGNTEKLCYEVVLDIEGTINFDMLEQPKKDSYEVKPIVEKINAGIFEIFKLHLSTPFLNDMVKGKSNKLLKGLNSNEQI